MLRRLTGLVLGALAVAALAAGPVAAQSSPTAEGTTISNTANASWKDANNNTYTASASVSVTVGFKSGLSVAGGADQTPNLGTATTLNFVVTNSGNGTDQIEAAFTVPAGITVAATGGYKLTVGATTTTYDNLAALNTALAATNIAAGGSVTVSLVYSVNSDQAGNTLTISMTATSKRDAGSSSDSVDVTGSATAGVDVNITSATTVTLTPSSGTNPTATFTVQNTGSGDATFTLAAASSNTTNATIVSIAGTGITSTGTGTGTIAITAGSTATVTVTFNVPTTATPAGTAEVSLTATHSNGTTSDNAKATVTVSRPSITVAKTALTSTSPETAVSGNVTPTQTLYYLVTVTNNGNEAAATVNVEDTLPVQVTYVGTTAKTGTWSFATADVTGSDGSTTVKKITATLDGSLAASGGSASFYIQVTVK